MVQGVIRNVRENPYSVTARLSSAKLGRTVQAESLLEYDFLNILDFDPRVEKYGEQCLAVPWTDESGRRKRYHPDVLVKFNALAMKADSRLGATVYEVKPAEILRARFPELKRRYRATVSCLKGTGVRFKLITDRQISRDFAANVRFLLCYKHERFQDDKSLSERAMDAGLLALVRGLKEPTTPRAILEHFSSDFDQRARLLARIWYFVAVCALEADLIAPLTMDTALWPSGSHRPFSVSFPIPKWRQQSHDWYR